MEEERQVAELECEFADCQEEHPAGMEGEAERGEAELGFAGQEPPPVYLPRDHLAFPRSLARKRGCQCGKWSTLRGVE
ncbi:hypothetical protein [Streptomyces sp. NPDC048438]|uniref:hypothetical protein n=1 Tax=Streptomyces sp. NPDC048438 TaxID=3365551 RepID=UPI0037121B04